MFSQALPNEQLPTRSRSAFLKEPKTLNNSLVDLSTDSFQPRRSRLNSEENENDAPYTRREPSRLYNFDSDSFFNPDDSLNGQPLTSRKPRSARGDPINQLSVHEIVRAKNTAERINELEKTNYNLRRMLQMVSTNKNGSSELAKSQPVKLLPSRSQNNLGPPILRQGRIGSSWRHIKQTNNYTNSNLLFIDGTVRINDSSRYPPRVYGYPPKEIEKTGSATDLIGLGTKSLNEIDFPLQQVRNRPVNLSAYENPFHERAKQGFEYWSKDKRLPENNKLKAPTIAIGFPFFKSGF